MTICCTSAVVIENIYCSVLLASPIHLSTAISGATAGEQNMQHTACSPPDPKQVIRDIAQAQGRAEAQGASGERVGGFSKA